MAVCIRLRRAGSNNRPFYRIVVTDRRSPIKGRYIESIGWYDPKHDGRNFELNRDRVQYWTQCGAQITHTVQSIIRKDLDLPAEPAAPKPEPEKAAPFQAEEQPPAEPEPVPAEPAAEEAS